MKKKSLITVLALVLVFAVAVGGVVAWLTATTAPVVNTFTVGDINITLTETGAVENAKTYSVVPGDTQSKDPKVTVEKGSEACWLFVKVTEANNTMTVGKETQKIVNYSVITGNNGWTQLMVDGENVDGVYYREVSADKETDQSFYVLTGNGTYGNGEVTINDNVAKGQITDANKPTLTFTAAAVQKDNINSAADAYAKLPSSFTGAAEP